MIKTTYRTSLYDVLDYCHSHPCVGDRGVGLATRNAFSENEQYSTFSLEEFVSIAKDIAAHSSDCTVFKVLKYTDIMKNLILTGTVLVGFEEVNEE